MADNPQLGEIVDHLIPNLGENVDDLVDHSGGSISQPKQPIATSGKSWLSSAGDYLGEALASLNPKTIAHGVKQIVTDLPGTVSAIGQAQGDLEQKAEAAFKAGDYATGARHLIHYLVPLLGPRLDQSSDLLAKGEIAKGLGAATDVGLQVALPKVLASTPPIKIPSPFRNRNPVDLKAVQFAESQGIPVNATTATGNRLIATAEHLTDRSLGGSLVSQGLEANQAAQLGRVGGELSERTSQLAPSAEQAGAAINSTLEDIIGAHHEQARKYYSIVDEASANPENATSVMSKRKSQIVSPSGDPLSVDVETKIPLAVNLAPHKAVLAPILEKLRRQYPVTQQELSPGLKALQNIVEGPDVAPLSQVDADLGALKTLARGADLPELKSLSQGVAAKAVRELSDAVFDAAAKAGPKVMDALERGRAATRAKYETRAIWNKIKTEPVKAFNQMVLPKDGGIELLGEVNRLAPNEIPKIGRAFLDDLLSKATSGGGFEKRGTIANKWENLGPQTKKILFQDPEHIKDLDNFFHYARISNKNPNPSGTAHTIATWKQGEWILNNPVTGIPAEIALGALSKILYSPKGVKLLNKGVKIPVGNQAAALALTTELAKIAGEDWELNPIGKKGKAVITSP